MLTDLSLAVLPEEVTDSSFKALAEAGCGPVLTSLTLHCSWVSPLFLKKTLEDEVGS